MSEKKLLPNTNVQYRRCVIYAECVVLKHGVFLYKPSVVLRTVCSFAFSV